MWCSVGRFLKNIPIQKLRSSYQNANMVMECIVFFLLSHFEPLAFWAVRARNIPS